MKFPALFRFRLWHLFVAIAVVCAALWVVTQAGMETAEIEILQFDTVEVFHIPGSVVVEDPSFPPIGTSFGQDPIIELVKVKFAFLEPESRRHETINVFLEPALTETVFEVGQRLKFQYRAKPILWFDAVNPTLAAVDLMEIEEDSIEEIITESGDPNIER